VRLKADQPDIYARIEHLEQVTDNIQMEVTLFVTEVLQMNMTPSQAKRAYVLIRLGDELESIVDYCLNLARFRRRLFSDGLKLSTEAEQELEELTGKVLDFYIKSSEFIGRRTEAGLYDEEVRELVRLADGIGDRADEIRDAHLKRVQEGACDARSGMIFSDIVVGLRRLKNHSVNLIDARVGRWEDRRDALRNLERSTRMIRAEPPDTP
jgi:phosphate:Na+ symporter